LAWRQVDFETRTILVISAKKGGPASRLVPIMHDKFFEKLKTWNRLDKNTAGSI
jgi:hypothetical protein